MTDPLAPQPQASSVSSARDDQIFPVAIYILYLLGLLNGVTILVGVIMAYALKERASEPHLSHYVFQIRTFWIGLIGLVAAGFVAAVGVPLAFIVIGFAFFAISGLMFAALWVWFLARSILGLLTLMRGDPYPRPRSLII